MIDLGERARMPVLRVLESSLFVAHIRMMLLTTVKVGRFLQFTPTLFFEREKGAEVPITYRDGDMRKLAHW